MNGASGMTFGFEHPLLVLAGLLIVPAAILLIRCLRRRLRNIFTLSIPLGAPDGIPFKTPVNMGALIKTLRVLEYAGVLLLFISAAGPVIKTSETVWLNRGADILFLIDTSPSMAAIDMDGASRFNTARNLIAAFAAKRPADGIGLAAVGSDAALLVPPTTDREVLRIRLEQLRIAELGDGTALGMGLSVAAFHLEKSTAPRRVAVLLTDGENNAGAIHPETAAEMLRDLGISLWVIGIGSGGEVPIDYVDPFTKMRRTGFFDSRYDTESLRRISAGAGGTYIAAPSADQFTAAFARLDNRETVVRRSGIVNKNRSCRMPFLLSAFALIAAVRFIRRVLLGARI